MRAEIITIGTEIMVGAILNTNSRYLSNKLVELGIETLYHTSVDDNASRLTEVINIALDRADIIITSGGLGPTQDDLTKEVVSKSLGLELSIDKEAEATLIKRFEAYHGNRKMTENNRKQATKPKGSKLIKNDHGTAPGVFIEKNLKKIIMLPGPPRELVPMFEHYVMDLIRDDFSIEVKSINTIGIGESTLEAELRTLDIFEDGFDIATFANPGNCEIKIIARAMDREILQEKMLNKISIIRDHFKDYIYGYDNISIEEVLVQRLIEKNYTLSFCESCTGGKISSKITSVPGASQVFDRGLITYSNKAKMDELGVSSITLEEHGAVSEETAYEMAKGLIDKTNSDIVLSITGVAGPGGGTEDKPLGLVYMCIMSKEGHKILKNNFVGNRVTVQERATMTALWQLNKYLSNI